MTPDHLEELTTRAVAELVRLTELSTGSGVRFLVADVVALVLADLPADLEATEELRAELVALVLGLMAGGVV
jgi:hypothetical protein